MPKTRWVSLICAGSLAVAPAADAAWTPTQSLTVGGPSAINRPVLATGGGGSLAVVWKDSVSGTASVWAAVRDAGGTLSGPVQLATPAQMVDYPDVAVDGAGNAVAIWQRSDGSNQRIEVATRAAGGGWSSAVPLSPAGEDASSPSVVVSASGDATAIWRGATGISVSERPAGGSWSAPAVLSVGSAPRLALDAAGNATAIWAISGAIGYADRPAGGAWSAPASFSIPGNALPALDVAPDGRAVVVWLDQPVHSEYGATRAPGGAWSAPAYIGYGSAYADNPAVALDDDGVATALWSDGSSIFSSRLTVGGSWSAPQRQAGQPTSVHAGFSDVYNARVAAGGHGIAVGSWRGQARLGMYGEAIIGKAGNPWSGVHQLGTTDSDVAVDDAGNAVVAWVAQGTLNVTSYDDAGPALNLSAPASGDAGAGIPMSVSAGDPGSLSGDPVWDFGDGGSGTGLSVSRAYTAAGTYTVHVTATDVLGHATTAEATVVISEPVPTPTPTPTATPTPPPGPAPVAAYSFENGSGSSLTDVTGNGHTGTISGAAWTTTGKYGKALKFDGTNDLVTIADAADLHLTSGMTLEAWVNPTKKNDWRTAILKEHSGDLDYALYSSGLDKPGVYIYTNGSTGSVNGPTAPAVNTWTHITATYNGSTLRIYVNGTQVASTSRTGNIRTGTGALRLGGNNVWGEWFQGQLDDVRIYNTALTAGQIQTDMSTPLG